MAAPFVPVITHEFNSRGPGPDRCPFDFPSYPGIPHPVLPLAILTCTIRGMLSAALRFTRGIGIQLRSHALHPTYPDLCVI